MACQLIRILLLLNAITFTELHLFDATNIDITNQCEYSWSTDGVCWTNWTVYLNYLLIAKQLESDFYLRIRLFGSFDRIILGDINTKCYNISIDNELVFLKNFCEDPNLWQPYLNLDCALLLLQLLSDSIICMLGIPIYYIKVSPDENSVDYTFKEYPLHNVESIKQIKLMIPDGEMPSSNPKLNEFDFDWETDWEVEISKTQFATAFGDNAFPKLRDFIYIPMMKRMWEVNSAYDEKKEGLMWRPTTWKLSLIKFNDSTNIETNDWGDVIDGWVKNQLYTTTIGPAEQKELEKETGAAPITAPSFAATNLTDIFIEDAVRKQITKQDVAICEKQFCHHNMVVGRNLYKFKNPNGCVTYLKGMCGDEGSIMFIIDLWGTLNGLESKNILEFGPVWVNITYDDVNKKFIIEYNELKLELDPFKTYLVMVKWNRNNFTTEFNIYSYSHKEGIQVYKLQPSMYYFDFENPICELTGVYNNDFIVASLLPCQVHAYPAEITNIKYYNKYLDKETSIKEALKYTTQNKDCVINDLARPISSGHGYNVR